MGYAGTFGKLLQKIAVTLVLAILKNQFFLNVKIFFVLSVVFFLIQFHFTLRLGYNYRGNNGYSRVVEIVVGLVPQITRRSAVKWERVVKML